MALFHVPSDDEAVLRSDLSCAFTTLNCTAEPLTKPEAPLCELVTGLIFVTSSIAFLATVLNARRKPNISRLFSDPTGSRLHEPLAAPVQGLAPVAGSLECVA